MAGVIWVTGAGGFTGHHLVAHLRSSQAQVRLVGLGRRPAPPDCELDDYHQLDLANDQGELRRLAQTERPARVYHLAGLLPPSPAPEYYLCHTQATVKLLLALYRADLSGHTRCLTVGSAAEYSTPYHLPIREDAPTGGQTEYGHSKTAQTATALALGQSLGLDVVAVRPFNLVGPRMSARLALGWLAEQVAEGQERVALGNLDSCRDFVDVRDAARAYEALLDRGRTGQVYNLCTGQPTAIRRLCQLLQTHAGRSIEFITDPGRVRSDDPAIVIGDPGRIRADCDWSPSYSLECSVRDVLAAAIPGSVSNG